MNIGNVQTLNDLDSFEYTIRVPYDMVYVYETKKFYIYNNQSYIHISLVENYNNLLFLLGEVENSNKNIESVFLRMLSVLNHDLKNIANQLKENELKKHLRKEKKTLKPFEKAIPTDLIYFCSIYISNKYDKLYNDFDGYKIIHDYDGKYKCRVWLNTDKCIIRFTLMEYDPKPNNTIRALDWQKIKVYSMNFLNEKIHVEWLKETYPHEYYFHDFIIEKYDWVTHGINQYFYIFLCIFVEHDIPHIRKYYY